jgi:AcrR family transcriptional regulator
MCARRYNRHRRDAAMEQTRRQILEAVTALHAERGGVKTSYAMIAERADVAIPTVYKHFPDMHALFTGCVGHVLAQAPAVGPEAFAALTDVPARLDALTRALCKRHRFLQPWLRWHEAEVLPALAPHDRAMREHQRALIADALAPEFGPSPPPALLGLLEALLDFTTWARLTGDAKLSDAAAADAVSAGARALVASFDARSTTDHDDASTHAAMRTSP